MPGALWDSFDEEPILLNIRASVFLVTSVGRTAFRVQGFPTDLAIILLLNTVMY